MLADLRKLDLEYDAISGSRTVMWEGEEVTLSQVRPAVFDPTATAASVRITRYVGASSRIRRNWPTSGGG